MRIVKENVEYQGTPSELAEFFNRSETIEHGIQKTGESSFTPKDFEPLEDIIEESESLRNKLAKNPSYNPHGGVLPSKEPETPDTIAPSGQLFTSEEDTGVELQ